MLNFFGSAVYAMGEMSNSSAGTANAAANQPSALGAFAPFIIIILVFYFLVFMPQKKERKKRDQMINELKIGNKIITLSGIYGEITKVEDDFIMVKIGENTKVKMTRSAVSTVVMEKKEDKK